MKKLVMFAVAAALALPSVSFAADTDAKLADRIEAAHAVLHELMATPDKGIPLDIAAKATCVAVVRSTGSPRTRSEASELNSLTAPETR